MHLDKQNSKSSMWFCCPVESVSPRHSKSTDCHGFNYCFGLLQSSLYNVSGGSCFSVVFDICKIALFPLSKASGHVFSILCSHVPSVASSVSNPFHEWCHRTLCP